MAESRNQRCYSRKWVISALAQSMWGVKGHEPSRIPVPAHECDRYDLSLRVLRLRSGEPHTVFVLYGEQEAYFTHTDLDTIVNNIVAWLAQQGAKPPADLPL